MNITIRNICMALLIFSPGALLAESLYISELDESIQNNIKRGRLKGANEPYVVNIGVGAMVYKFRTGGSWCHVLLDRTDFENVTKNGLKIEKEQVMGFSCFPS